MGGGLRLNSRGNGFLLDGVEDDDSWHVSFDRAHLRPRAAIDAAVATLKLRARQARRTTAVTRQQQQRRRRRLQGSVARHERPRAAAGARHGYARMRRRERLPAYDGRRHLRGGAIDARDAGARGDGRQDDAVAAALYRTLARLLPVVASQPRRISAASSPSAAAERGGRLGGLVGFKIRFEDHVSPSSRLIFCTVGVLLRTLQSTPPRRHPRRRRGARARPAQRLLPAAAQAAEGARRELGGAMSATVDPAPSRPTSQAATADPRQDQLPHPGARGHPADAAARPRLRTGLGPQGHRRGAPRGGLGGGGGGGGGGVPAAAFGATARRPGAADGREAEVAAALPEASPAVCEAIAAPTPHRPTRSTSTRSRVVLHIHASEYAADGATAPSSSSCRAGRRLPRRSSGWARGPPPARHLPAPLAHADGRTARHL